MYVVHNESLKKSSITSSQFTTSNYTNQTKVIEFSQTLCTMTFYFPYAITTTRIISEHLLFVFIGIFTMYSDNRAHALMKTCSMHKVY